MRNVARKITVGGRDVTGQRETRQGCNRQVGGAAHAGLEHTAAPNWHILRAAHVVNFKPLAQPANASGLDVDDTAGLHLDSIASMTRRNYAFVLADRCFELRLQFAVVPDVIFEERLFDE